MQECNYCLKEVLHGGKCYARKSNCILFERDPRGRQLYLYSIRFEIRFGLDMLEIGKPDDRWTLWDVEKTITVSKILKVEWNTNARGLQGVNMWVDLSYWSEENGVIPEKQERPKLRFSGRFDSGWDWRTSMTFVFDPFHWWR